MSKVSNNEIRERPVGKKIWREAITAARFGLVGIIATTIHILTVSILLFETFLPTLVANACAFGVAFGFSFAGNYFWTFQLPGEPCKAMRRFLLISLTAFCANSLILASILRAGWLTPFFATIISASIVPLITFLASRLWGFQYAGRQ